MNESEQLIAGWFHAIRSSGKRKPIAGEDRIQAALFRRMHIDGAINDETFVGVMRRIMGVSSHHDHTIFPQRRK